MIIHISGFASNRKESPLNNFMEIFKVLILPTVWDTQIVKMCISYCSSGISKQQQQGLDPLMLLYNPVPWDIFL